MSKNIEGFLYTRIAEIREQQGMTQKELADKSNLTVDQLDAIETSDFDRYEGNNIDLKLIAEALNVEYRDVIR
ncbi:helix-turn-helix transcriptional regulator [Halobacillus sp. ACCC02827]|uniref:helix-turn-helix domain-containing protein n=1 Tax=Bacillaceae TaxID=186817 RepID=UPI0002A4DE54|nr:MULTISPECIES: helix-turn-helix transcriptional regulator [Bacillaceae]ELK48466.1 hypothetical protein D479_02562 [Halobacillus sp. BAB-2008]QHT47846.1 helix-turn-helix transcriptional regulator [Bacillus sp. SB49]WJE15086.1 helix-turn-helix transcriptional regulator [Halobacillus sp. ACCC02827]